MDYAKAVTFFFQEDNWIGTLLIGGGVILIGFFFFWTIIGPFLAYALVAGYMMQLIRDIHKNPDAPLPEWDEWGKKLVDGSKLLVAQFIWGLPIFLISIPFLFTLFLPAFFPDSDAAAILSMFGYLAFLCLMFFYTVFFMIVHPAITINLTIHDDFGKAFDFSTIFQIIKDHLGEVIIIALVLFGIGYVASFVGMLLLFIGTVFTSFWVELVRGHLYGQLARLAFPAPDSDSSLTAPQPATTES